MIKFEGDENNPVVATGDAPASDAPAATAPAEEAPTSEGQPVA